MTIADIERYILECIRILKFKNLKSSKYNKYKVKVLENKLNYVFSEIMPIDLWGLKSKIRKNNKNLIIDVYIEGYTKEKYSFLYNLMSMEMENIINHF